MVCLQGFLQIKDFVSEENFFLRVPFLEQQLIFLGMISLVA